MYMLYITTPPLLLHLPVPDVTVSVLPMKMDAECINTSNMFNDSKGNCSSRHASLPAVHASTAAVDKVPLVYLKTADRFYKNLALKN